MYGDLVHIGNKSYISYYYESALSTFINETIEYDGILIVGVAPLIEVDPTTVGQYTGLTDKNGKKIFEGDIVDCLEYYGEVYYDSDCCFDLRDNTSEMCGGFIGSYNSLKIIGNIHDNPELLDNSELLEDKP